jgi:hypothetical protein
VIANPRWREVIRLLVADRQSEESQRALTDRILTAAEDADEAAIAALAGGLLIDRIPAATERAADVLECLLVATAKCADDEAAAPALLTQLATLLHRDENAGAVWDDAVARALKRTRTDANVRAGIVLAAFTVPLPPERVRPLMATLWDDDAKAAALAEGLLWGAPDVAPPGQAALQALYDAAHLYAFHSPQTNWVSALFAGSLPGPNAKLIARILISAAAASLVEKGCGPFDYYANNHLILHTLQLRYGDQSATDKVKFEFRWPVHAGKGVAIHVMESIYKRRANKAFRNFSSSLWRAIDGASRNRVWLFSSSERTVHDAITSSIIIPLSLQRVPIWQEALRRHFLPALSDRHTVFRPETLERINADLASRRLDGDAPWRAACWLLLDAGFELSRLLEPETLSALADLISFSERTNHPVLAFVRTLRHAWRGDEAALESLIATIKDPPSALKEILIEACLIAPPSARVPKAPVLADG